MAKTPFEGAVTEGVTSREEALRNGPLAGQGELVRALLAQQEAGRERRYGQPRRPPQHSG